MAISNTKAYQSSHDDTTNEYDYAYAHVHAHHDHLLHHNTAANTTYTQISVDQEKGFCMKNVHSLGVTRSTQPSNEGEYGVVNQLKSDYLDYEITGDAKGPIHTAVDQSNNGGDEYGVVNQHKSDDPNL